MHWATCQFQSLLWATCQLVCIGQRVNLHALDSVSTPKPPLGNVSTCMHWTTCQLVRIGQRVNLYALGNVSTCMQWTTCQLVYIGQRVNSKASEQARPQTTFLDFTSAPLALFLPDSHFLLYSAAES